MKLRSHFTLIKGNTKTAGLQEYLCIFGASYLRKLYAKVHRDAALACHTLDIWVLCWCLRIIWYTHPKEEEDVS